MTTSFQIKKPILPDTIAICLGLVIGLLLCAVIIAGLGTHSARSSADEVKNRYLPLMETALSLERTIYETVFHVSMFGTSGDMASYSGSRILFPAVRGTAEHLANQTLNIPDRHPLARDLEILRDLAEHLNLVVEKTRTLNDELTAEQEKLQKTADDMGEILLDLQARIASAEADKDATITLDEKARLLILNGFSLAVADVTGRVLAAGVAKNAGNLVKAQEYFVMRWKEAREACATAAAIPPQEGSGAARSAVSPVDDMIRLAASYGEILRTIRFNLEESARLAQDRATVTSRLTILTRSIVTAIRSSMSAAADRTDTALRGATVTLFASALLACILGIGAAVTFVRPRRR